MSQPSKPAFLDFKIHTCAPSLLVKVIVGNFVGPEDVADPSQTAVVKNMLMLVAKTLRNSRRSKICSLGSHIYTMACS